MPRQNKYYFFILFFIFALALFLRFYVFYDTVAFRADQASDLFISRQILESNLRPSIGPFLSVSGFHTPASYYYLLAGLLFIFRTPQGVTFAFAVMNLLAMWLLIKTVTILLGKTSGLIAGFLFAISDIMVTESRQMWQLHPLTLFVTASVLCLISAFQRKSFFLYIFSLVLYAAALSIYVSPIVLLPFYVKKSGEFLHSFFGKKIHMPYIWGLGMLAAVATPFFTQFIRYEWLQGFPTIAAVRAGSFGPPLSLFFIFVACRQYITGFIEHLFGIVQTGISPISFVTTPIEIVFLTVILFPQLYLSRRYLSDYRKKIGGYIPMALLVLGSTFLFFFRNAIQIYRIYVFFPFFLIQCTYLLRIAFQTKRRIVSAAISLLVIFYTVGNLASIRSTLFQYPRNDVLAAQETASVIGYDAGHRGLRSLDMTVLAYRYPDVYNNYFLFPYLYYLPEFAGYTMPVVPAGNDVNRAALDHPATPVVYLICAWYRSLEEARNHCYVYFQRTNPPYGLAAEQTVTKDTFVAVFRRIQ